MTTKPFRPFFRHTLNVSVQKRHISSLRRDLLHHGHKQESRSSQRGCRIVRLLRACGLQWHHGCTVSKSAHQDRDEREQRFLQWS
jgi:hypothetical protein